MLPSMPRGAAPWCALAAAAVLVGSPDFMALERAVSKIFVAEPAAPAPSEERTLSVFETPTLVWAISDLDRPRTGEAIVSSDETPAGSAPASTAGRGARALAPLYVSFIALQALDVHSTLRALDHGAGESNPLMAPLTERPAAFVAMKVATTAGILYMTERVRRRSPLAAIVMMAAFNSAYATVVANNYRIGNRLRQVP